MHPVLLTHAYENEIKVVAAGVPLSIPFLLASIIDVPFIDYLRDGETPFSYGVFGLIG
jgi:NCAIR mutase (PurE)-related protein